jgi:hypothetical protein
MRLASMLTLALVAALATAASAAPLPPLAQRVAVLVGANQPGEGRQPLQHAHRDAEQMAEVLVTVGRFDRERVHVLRDPTPAQVLALIERYGRELRQPDSLFYFYFSGHADEHALYPAGQPLALDALRAALDGTGASVRLGMVDACRGGGWTRAKGLTPDAPFEVQTPVNLGSEGSVLIASSSGAESAHESDVLQGSFFTHHFMAGLRGAADKSGNGEVTLSEAFEYAKERTVRDTARLTREPQHPSYAVNLRGRQDLVLAQIAQSPSTMVIAQEQGPLDLIQLDTGLNVLELSPGARRVRLALRPGRYLLRRAAGGGNFTREVLVAAGTETQVTEAELVLVGEARLARKDAGEPLPLAAYTSLPGRTLALSLATGLTVGWSKTSIFGSQIEARKDPAAVELALDGSFVWAPTDRLSWAVGTGAFAYRFGTHGGWELVPTAGVGGWGYSSIEGWLVQPVAGLAVRRWLGERLALTAGGGAMTMVVAGSSFNFWRVGGSAGVLARIAEGVSLSFAVETVRQTDGRRGEWHVGGQNGFELNFGSVQTLALRTAPLLQVQLSRHFTLDLTVRVGRSFAAQEWRYASLLGSTVAF